MKLRLLLIVLLMPVLHAELPPSAYESMQAKAPEYFKVEILRVDVEPEKPLYSRKFISSLSLRKSFARPRVPSPMRL